MPLKALERSSADIPSGPAGFMSIPLHSKKFKERKFNQNALLGLHLSKALKTPLLVTSLRKTRETKLQMEMSGKDRRFNLIKAYTVNGDIRGKRLLLADGVITTEARVREYAATMKRPGASTVDVFALTLSMSSINY